MADNTDQAPVRGQHFDLNEIVREEKRKGKKKKHRKEAQDQGGLQEDFRMQINDPRFKDMFDNHEFAIDPSNPRLKATPGMKVLLEEQRKRKSGMEDQDSAGTLRHPKKAKTERHETTGLAHAFKRKSKQVASRS